MRAAETCSRLIADSWGFPAQLKFIGFCAPGNTNFDYFLLDFPLKHLQLELATPDSTVSELARHRGL